MIPCTDCGEDASRGYGCTRGKTSWGGLVKKGERLCAGCFEMRREE